MTVPGTATLRHGDLFLVQQVFHRIAIGIFLQRLLCDVFRITIEDYLASKTACIRSDIYQMVGSTHDILIMFHHDNGIA